MGLKSMPITCFGLSSVRRTPGLWCGNSLAMRFWVLVADIQCPYTLLMSQYHGFKEYSIGPCQFLFPCPPPSGDSLLVQRMAFHQTCEGWHDIQDPCYPSLAGNYSLDRGDKELTDLVLSIVSVSVSSHISKNWAWRSFSDLVIRKRKF